MNLADLPVIRSFAQLSRSYTRSRFVQWARFYKRWRIATFIKGPYSFLSKIEYFWRDTQIDEQHDIQQPDMLQARNTDSSLSETDLSQEREPLQVQYTWPFCGEDWKSLPGLRIHVTKKHTQSKDINVLKSPQIQCQICSESIDEDKVQQHMENTHSNITQTSQAEQQANSNVTKRPILMWKLCLKEFQNKTRATMHFLETHKDSEEDIESCIYMLYKNSAKY